MSPADQRDQDAGLASPEYASSRMSITSASHGTQAAPWRLRDMPDISPQTTTARLRILMWREEGWDMLLVNLLKMFFYAQIATQFQSKFTIGKVPSFKKNYSNQAAQNRAGSKPFPPFAF